MKTVKIAMRELIEQGFEVFLLQHHVFDLIASNDKEVKFIKTVYSDVIPYSTITQRERLSKFYKYPKYVDENNLTQHKCFTKELWVRSTETWSSKIIIK